MSGPAAPGGRSLEQAMEEARRASRAAADDACKARVAVQAARNIANAAKKTAEEALSLNQETLALAREALAEAKAARSQAAEWSGWDGRNVRQHVEDAVQLASAAQDTADGVEEATEGLSEELAHLKRQVRNLG